MGKCNVDEIACIECIGIIDDIDETATIEVIDGMDGIHVVRAHLLQQRGKQFE